MTEHPILFSAPMIRALISGRKSCTRRVVKDQRLASQITGWGCIGGQGFGWIAGDTILRCPYGDRGDPGGARLWVRETWAHDAESLEALRSEMDDAMPPVSGLGHGPYYRADGIHENTGLRWRPSIHMPRWASRLTLEVLSVRVERLQAITPSDIEAEGFACEFRAGPGTPSWDEQRRIGFAEGWDRINGKRKGCAWADSPWVWVVAFRRVEGA